jgi:DNA-binding NtrC family response regulator
MFVNRAWEALAGLGLREVRGLACKRRILGPDVDRREALQSLLAPPAEAVAGKSSATRRLVPGVLAATDGAAARWWDIAFFPFADAAGLLGILGKIMPVPSAGLFEGRSLPENIIALRQRLVRGFDVEQIPGDLPAMRRVIEQVRLSAATHSPALLLGERGTGKHWLARCIHQQSSRREAAFVTVDCARLPERALADILLGEGSIDRRLRAGTVYVREPARLPREMQERLARLACSWKESSNSQLPVLLAGSTSDPQEDLRAGRLLGELHCLLSPLTITLPPLRERLQDLPWLSQRLLERAGVAAGHTAAGLTDDAMAVLRSYAWPGNIRELYQVLVTACGRAKEERIGAGDLPYHLRATAAPAVRALPLDSLLEQVERRLILLALKQTKNKTEAAELLSIWRQRLIRRMEALGIEDTP